MNDPQGPPPQAASDPEMTFDEKMALADDITRLNGAAISDIVVIIRNGQPPSAADAGLGGGGGAAAGGACSAVASAASVTALEGMFFDLRASMQEDMRGLHLELIRELEAQRHEMRAIIASEQQEAAALRAENERLRAENRQLRGPLESLAVASDLA